MQAVGARLVSERHGASGFHLLGMFESAGTSKDMAGSSKYQGT